MAKTFLRLDTRRALADGTYPIQIAVGYGTNMYIGTGLSAKVEDWDERAKQYTGAGAKRINNVLTTLLVQISNRVLDLRERGMLGQLSKSQLKAMLADLDIDAPPMEQKSSVGDVFAQAIATKNKGNAVIYAATLQKLKGYCNVDALRFEDVSRAWLDGFNAYMGGLSVNTRAIHMRNLRAVFNYAIDEGITSAYPFRKYKIKKEETRKRSLTVEQLRQLRDYPCEPYQEKYRDIFILMFYLIGVNAVDLFNATKLVNGRLEYKRAKTGKLYSIKVEPEAMEIIERYKGDKYLLNVLDGYANYRDFMRRMGDGLKQIGECKRSGLGGKKHITPLFPDLSSYWARHTWATLAAQLDVPKETIAAALGHEIGMAVTSIYIDFNQRKIDEANRKVLDYVRGEK